MSSHLSPPSGDEPGAERALDAALSYFDHARLQEALWAYANAHNGAFPGDEFEPSIPRELWKPAEQSGSRYVYLPGRTLPMLPEMLSNGICSLRPGVRPRRTTPRRQSRRPCKRLSRIDSQRFPYSSAAATSFFSACCCSSISVG